MSCYSYGRRARWEEFFASNLSPSLAIAGRGGGQIWWSPVAAPTEPAVTDHPFIASEADPSACGQRVTLDPRFWHGWRWAYCGNGRQAHVLGSRQDAGGAPVETGPGAPPDTTRVHVWHDSALLDTGYRWRVECMVPECGWEAAGWRTPGGAADAGRRHLGDTHG